MDNAATTYPKPDVVYRTVDGFMRDIGGSAGRSGHRRAVQAGRVVFETRCAAAELFNVEDPLRIALTKNVTEALNYVIWGLLEPGDHVVVSSMEHNAVMRPLTAADEKGISHSIARCDDAGRLDPEAVAGEMRPETALVIVNHASNVAGTILPVREVVEVAHQRGVPVLVDAAQTAGRLSVDVEADGMDILAFTGHKELFGPQGTGGFYVREGLDFPPVMQGGTGSQSSDLRQPGNMPERFESGTMNAPGIAGLGAGIRFVTETGVERIREHELGMLTRLSEGLDGIDGVRSLGPEDPTERVGIVPLLFEGLTPAGASEVLDTRFGIATRAGMHCSPMAHRTIGTLETGVTRVSFSYMNTNDEVDYLLECLEQMT